MGAQFGDLKSSLQSVSADYVNAAGLKADDFPFAL
jgi:hypothetical protein